MYVFLFREDWKPVLTINAIIIGLQYLFLVSGLSEFWLEKLCLFHIPWHLRTLLIVQNNWCFNYVRSSKYFLCSILESEKYLKWTFRRTKKSHSISHSHKLSWLCFYNSIEQRIICFLFLWENIVWKRKENHLYGYYVVSY